MTPHFALKVAAAQQTRTLDATRLLTAVIAANKEKDLALRNVLEVLERDADLAASRARIADAAWLYFVEANEHADKRYRIVH